MENLKLFLSDNSDAPGFSIVESVSEKLILKSEKTLGIIFSPELREYLKLFGTLSFRSVEFFGLGFNEKSFFNIVSRTIELKEKYSIPENHVPIEYLGEGYYALYDCRSGNVYEWQELINSKRMKILGKCLDNYMTSRLRMKNET